MTLYIVNLIGLILIALIVWWFWLGSKGESQKVTEDTVSIDVDGGIYDPSQITVTSGQEVTLRFTRHDPSPCAEMVVFPDLGISKELPIAKPYDIPIKVNKPGTYEFTCAMGMYRGKLIVE